MFCPNCRANVPEGSTFCSSCGSPLPAAQPAAAPAPAPAAAPRVAFSGSTWDGGVFETIITSIAASVMISLTCGFATPWAVCYLYKFILSHTVIDGKRLTFDGDGASLLGNWIVWWLLTLVTCGIYSFWVTPKLYQWIASHTHHAN